MTSDDLGPSGRDLIARLREEPDETPPEASSRAARRPDEPDAPPRAVPDGATFVVQDDWDDAMVRPATSRAGADTRGWRERLDTAVLRHVAKLLLFALAVIGALAGLGVAYLHLVGDPLADARVYYDAATRLNHGQPLYLAGANPNAAELYRYPPLLAIVLRPVAVLPYEAFALLWEGVVVASFALLARQLGARSSRTWLAIGILGVPIGWALSIAQAQVPLTLLLAIGQPWSIALATNLQLFPALAALWWIGRRDGQATLAFLIWTGLLALGQWIIEPGGSASFVRSVGTFEVGDVRNISPYALAPELWLVLFGVGIVAAITFARTRWGWPIAVALVTLSPPRLLVYGLTGLLAALREPEQANLPQPEPRPWQHVVASGRH